MHLLDTGVVAALRGAPATSTRPGLFAWAASVAVPGLFISALTLHDLEVEAMRAARRDRDGGALLRQWLDEQVSRAFDGRVLAVDVAVVRRAVQLDYADQRDALLAATALVHGLTLVTFRPAMFKSGKVRLYDPTRHADQPPVAEDWRQATRAAPAWIKNLFVRS